MSTQNKPRMLSVPEITCVLLIHHYLWACHPSLRRFGYVDDYSLRLYLGLCLYACMFVCVCVCVCGCVCVYYTWVCPCFVLKSIRRVLLTTGISIAFVRTTLVSHTWWSQVDDVMIGIIYVLFKWIFCVSQIKRWLYSIHRLIHQTQIHANELFFVGYVFTSLSIAVAIFCVCVSMCVPISVNVFLSKIPICNFVYI